MMMKALAAAVSAIALASSAQALTLIDAQVTGSVNGTVWNTTSADTFYTLFLQTPGLGNFLNPNDQAISLNVGSEINNVLLAGEGFFPGSNLDSDPLYNLTLSFDGGQTLIGSYIPATNTFVSGSSFIEGGLSYTLTSFSYRRFLGDAVSAFQATPGGDPNDYAGGFRVNVTSVPEPATWALMLGGFGMMGFAARRRRDVRSVVA